jgi:hypothetical protein
MAGPLVPEGLSERLQLYRHIGSSRGRRAGGDRRGLLLAAGRSIACGHSLFLHLHADVVADDGLFRPDLGPGVERRPRSGLSVRALADLVQPRLHRIREGDRQGFFTFELAFGRTDAPVRPKGSGGGCMAVRFRSLHASDGGRPVRRFGAHSGSRRNLGRSRNRAGCAAAAARGRRCAGWIRLRGGYRQQPDSTLRP